MGKSITCLRNEVKAIMDRTERVGINTVKDGLGEVGRDQTMLRFSGHVKLQARGSCQLNLKLYSVT